MLCLVCRKPNLCLKLQDEPIALGAFLHSLGHRLRGQKLAMHWREEGADARWWEAKVLAYDPDTARFRSAKRVCLFAALMPKCYPVTLKFRCKLICCSSIALQCMLSILGHKHHQLAANVINIANGRSGSFAANTVKCLWPWCSTYCCSNSVPYACLL